MDERSILKLIPVELLHEIVSYLPHSSRLALYLSCKELNAKLQGQNCLARSSGRFSSNYTMTDLLEIEQWAPYYGANERKAYYEERIDGLDSFACHICMRIRHASEFASSMVKNKLGKRGIQNLYEKRLRYCISCGLGSGRYPRFAGTTFKVVGGQYGFSCRTCGRFTMASAEAFHSAERDCAVCTGENMQDLEIE